MSSSSPLVPLAVAAVGGLALYGALRATRARARIYDVMIVQLTAGWYAEVLQRLPKGCTFLDVGIGTGLALLNNSDLLQRKDISVVGVDYDEDYVKRCKALVTEHQLTSQVQVEHASIYDFQGGPFDAVYFSSSLMLMPDAVKALQHCVSMLKPKTGKVYVTQTIQTRHSVLVEVAKPLLKFLTTIDFGTVTYEEDLLTTFKKAGLTLREHVPISKSTMTSTRSFRLFVLEP
jgi:2-polyprenyl-3-methyl-5-hydroxy-6-metoxy-1,4-benzoquinol methylase